MLTNEIQRKRLPIAPKFLCIFVLYVLVSLALSILSLTMAANNDGVAAIWLPAGSALIALVFIDMRLWPGIALASLVSNLYFGLNIQAAVGISLGSALGALTAAFALRALGPWKNLTVFLKALKLGTAGATISSAISASLGVASLSLSGALASDLAITWARWFIGDSVGIFLFSSFILIYYMLVDDDRADSKAERTAVAETTPCTR